MNVVGHQAIGPAGDPIGSAALGEQVAIESVIARFGEQRLSTIAPLRHMMGQAGNGDAGKARHDGSIITSRYYAMCIMSPNTPNTIPKRR